MSGGRRAEVLAPAKVNLYLRVLGRRADGYHEIETLFQAVDLADEVCVELGGSGVSLDVDGPALGPVEENLAVRAARSFRAAAGLTEGVRIRLRKRIPAGAGLGGGSSDAAAVLAALSALVAGAPSAAELRARAATLGSDVPFFLCGSSLAIGRGRGEVLEPLEPLPPADLVLVLPPLHVSTRDAYEALGAPSLPLGWEAEGESIGAPGGWVDVCSRARNDFQSFAAARHPHIARSLGALSAAGASLAMLSGSGGACFGLFERRSRAIEAASNLSSELGWPAVAVRTSTRRSPPPGAGADSAFPEP